MSEIQPILIDPTLHLVPAHPSQAAELFEKVEENREFLRRWLPWLDLNQTVEDSRAFLEDCDWKNQSGESLQYCVYFEGQLKGLVGTHKIDMLNHQTSLGYWLAEDALGKGLISRSVQALLYELFEVRLLHRVVIQCAVGNHRSEAIPKRLGFKYEGMCRQSEWLYDHFVDLKRYSQLKPEWEGFVAAG